MFVKGKAYNFVKKMGYEIIPTWRLPNLALSEHLRKLFHQLDIKTVLDVGANEGQFHDFIRNEVGFSGEIISFEPLRDLYEHLSVRSSSDKKWKVFQLALGSCDSQQVINVTRDSKFSSFHDLNDTSATPWAERKEVINEEKVYVARLDTIANNELREIDWRHCYLKMDTQGYDLEVIKGAAVTVKQIAALQTEISFRPVYKDMPSFFESIQTFQEQGFCISNIIPVSHDGLLRLVEADCILLNTSHTN